MSDVPKSEQNPSTLEGSAPELADDASLRDAIEKAFDYRGDVTLETADGRTLEGYIFDRRADGDPPTLRMVLADGSRQSVAYGQITALKFTGRDTAAGKSWETWVRKYVEKKLAGQTASIEPEKLD
jgi:hypothetical protein